MLFLLHLHGRELLLAEFLVERGALLELAHAAAQVAAVGADDHPVEWADERSVQGTAG
jgi:hypothetical protein